VTKVDRDETPRAAVVITPWYRDATHQVSWETTPLIQSVDYRRTAPVAQRIYSRRSWHIEQKSLTSEREDISIVSSNSSLSTKVYAQPQCSGPEKCHIWSSFRETFITNAQCTV